MKVYVFLLFLIFYPISTRCLMHMVFSASELLCSHVLSMCSCWKTSVCISFPIFTQILLVILCTWYSQLVSCCLPMNEVHVAVKSVYISLPFQSFTQISFVIFCTWYSQQVSCCFPMYWVCVLSCWKCMYFFLSNLLPEFHLLFYIPYGTWYSQEVSCYLTMH